MLDSVLSKAADIIIMLWSSIYIIFDIFTANLCSVAVSVTVKILCEPAVIMIELTILEFAVKEQLLINQ